MMKAPRRGLRLAKFQVLSFLLLGFLLPDVVADRLFDQTDGAHAIPTRPEVVAREVLLAPKILAMDPDRRLPFQKPHRVRHTELRRNPQQHMPRDPAARALPPIRRRAADTTPERSSQSPAGSARRSSACDTSGPTRRGICNTIGRGIGSCHSRMTVSFLNWGVHDWARRFDCCRDWPKSMRRSASHRRRRWLTSGELDCSASRHTANA